MSADPFRLGVDIAQALDARGIPNALVGMMGDDDPRVAKWDELVEAYGR